ncbi:hypothetical protein V6N13_100437 [Hibiscus sabdariffa]
MESPSVSCSGSSAVGVECPACSFFGTHNTFNGAFKVRAILDEGVIMRRVDQLKGSGEGRAKQKQVTWADIVKHNGVHKQGQSFENSLSEGAHIKPSLQLEEHANKPINIFCVRKMNTH